MWNPPLAHSIVKMYIPTYSKFYEKYIDIFILYKYLAGEWVLHYQILFMQFYDIKVNENWHIFPIFINL